jgi:hypothetical protein
MNAPCAGCEGPGEADVYHSRAATERVLHRTSEVTHV